MKTPVVSLLFILLTTPMISAATATTGSIAGIVRDSSGQPLAGVALTLSGPHLPGSRAAASDHRGAYRFPLLPPGDAYRIEAALEGFQRVANERVVVLLGRDSALDLVLHPATSDEVTVSATPPLIDVVNATSVTNVTSDLIEALPTRRDFQQLAALAPAAVFDRNRHSPAISGATHLENDYIIEGMSTRDPLTAKSAANLTMDFVEEIQIATAGLSAEHGRSTGGLISVLTKSGGNSLTSNVVAYYEDHDWASNRVTQAFRGSEFRDDGKDKKDLAVSFAGPLKRDRLWFFSAFNPRRDVTPIRVYAPELGVDRKEALTRVERVYAGKITLALTPSQMLTASGFGNPNRLGGWRANPRADPTTAIWTDYAGSRNIAVQYHAAPGSNATAEAVAGRHDQSLYTLGNSPEGRSVPLQIDLTVPGGLYHGGVPYRYSDRSTRNAAGVRMSRIVGRHEIRSGVDYERNRHDLDSFDLRYYFMGQTRVNDEIGIQDVMTEQFLDFRGYGTNDGSAGFLQDRWRATPNVVVTAGLRYEQQTVGSGQGVVVTHGKSADGSLDRRASRTFTFDGNWAPRLGIAWDPTGAGRGKVYVSAGRYFESIPLSINVNALNGFGLQNRHFYSTSRHTSANWFNPTGSPLNADWIEFRADARRFNSGIANTGPTPLAADARLPMQDEWAFGGEYRLGSHWVAGARLIGRTLRRVLEDVYVVNPQHELVISNPGVSAISPEYRRPRREYRAVELMLERRLSDRWQAVTSFVSARSRGDYEGLYDSANGAELPNEGWNVEEQAWQKMSYGRLRADVPYQFKVAGSYRFPFGLRVSEMFTYSAGVPVSAFAARRLLFGIRGIHLVPRGSMGRTPDRWNLDLHADWALSAIRRWGIGLTLIADVFNATDKHGVLDVEEEYFWNGQPEYAQWIAPSNRDASGLPKFNPDLPTSPFYKTPTRFQQPRTIQLGVKLSY